MRIALVKWRDAITQQEDGAEARAQVAILTEIGFLLDENAQAILIGMESDSSTNVVPGRFRLHIPRSNIIELHITDVGKAFTKKSLVWQA